jgi:hypothetical protein
LQKKQCGSSYQSSQESADSERWEDTLGEILGGIEARGRLRGIRYGDTWKEYLLESLQLAKQRRRSRKESDLEFKDMVQDEVTRALLARGLVLGLAPLHPFTETMCGSTEMSPSSIQGSQYGFPSPIDDISVSIVSSAPYLD